MRGEVLITRASSSPVTSCPLLLYERIIIGLSVYANAHAEFLSRWAPLSAFRTATREEDDATDRIETPRTHRHTYTREMQDVLQSERLRGAQRAIRSAILMTSVRFSKGVVEQTISSSRLFRHPSARPVTRIIIKFCSRITVRPPISITRGHRIETKLPRTICNFDDHARVAATHEGLNPYPATRVSRCAALLPHRGSSRRSRISAEVFSPGNANSINRKRFSAVDTWASTSARGCMRIGRMRQLLRNARSRGRVFFSDPPCLGRKGKLLRSLSQLP